MPKNLPKRCKVCGAHVDDGVPISRRGLCYPCGEQRVADAIRRTHELFNTAKPSPPARTTTRSRREPSRGVGGTTPAKRATTTRRRAS